MACVPRGSTTESTVGRTGPGASGHRSAQLSVPVVVVVAVVMTVVVTVTVVVVVAVVTVTAPPREVVAFRASIPVVTVGGEEILEDCHVFLPLKRFLYEIRMRAGVGWLFPEKDISLFLEGFMSYPGFKTNNRWWNSPGH
jgi:hypothetical protein